MSPNFLEYAIWYARLGWSVFPVRPNEKRPLTSTGFHAATRDEERIRGWWAQWPDANIGVAADESCLVVYDVDVADGKCGAESHAQIAHLLPTTLSARTRSGGLHFYYIAPPGAPLRRQIGFRPPGVEIPAGKKSTGLDLLTDGYVLAPPSIVGGQPYEWINPDVDLVMLPQFLIDAARARPEPRETVDVPADGTIVSGQRNNALYTLACRMRNAGLSHADVLSSLLTINDDRVDPPLPQDEVVAIAASATARVEFATEQTDALILQAVSAANGRSIPGTNITIVDGPDDQSQVDDVLDRLLISKGAAKPTPTIVVHPTGFPDLDAKLGGGFSSRQLTTIMGGPAAGKSALAISFARHLTTVSEARPVVPPVLIVSTELEFFEVAGRFAAPAIGKPWRDIIRDKELYSQVKDVTKDAPVYILDVTGLESQFEGGLQQIYEMAKRIEIRHGQPPIVMVDYLQELAANVEASEKTAKTGQVANALRKISQQVPCVVLAIASVSRAGYGLNLQAIRDQDDARAYLALAKESGHIEYASATLLFVDVEPEELGNDRVGRIAVAKSRHGDFGFVGVRFQPAMGVYSPDVAAGQKPLMSGTKAKNNLVDKAKVATLVAQAPGTMGITEVAKNAGVQIGLVAGMVADGLLVKRGRFLFVEQATADHPEPDVGVGDAQ